jgi:hypothetical protein
VRWKAGVLAGLCAGALAAAAMAAPATPAERSVAIFYYPWYGTPSRDGAWQHWNQAVRRPPADIASGYYPMRGAYSSSDPGLIRQQMQEIAAAGVDTVIVSWWGRGSAEDRRLRLVTARARAAGLDVAVHIEPYAGRTPSSTVDDIFALRALGYHDYYVYDSTFDTDAEWAEALARVVGVRVFANTALVGRALAGGFDGIYTYDVLVYTGASFPRICAQARKVSLLCAPSVGPGFDPTRATPLTSVRPRRDGETYDYMWRQAIRGAADIVTITSYNEWNEGTQIEPARAAGPRYATYDGAFGLSGRAAEDAYLTRTAFWASVYRSER